MALTKRHSTQAARASEQMHKDDKTSKPLAPVQAQHAPTADSQEEADLEQVAAAAMLTDNVLSEGQRQSWPPPGSLNCPQPDSQGSADVSPNGKGGPM